MPQLKAPEVNRNSISTIHVENTQFIYTTLSLDPMTLRATNHLEDAIFFFCGEYSPPSESREPIPTFHFDLDQ